MQIQTLTHDTISHLRKLEADKQLAFIECAASPSKLREIFKQIMSVTVSNKADNEKLQEVAQLGTLGENLLSIGTAYENTLHYVCCWTVMDGEPSDRIDEYYFNQKKQYFKTNGHDFFLTTLKQTISLSEDISNESLKLLLLTNEEKMRSLTVLETHLSL